MFRTFTRLNGSIGHRYSSAGIYPYICIMLVGADHSIEQKAGTLNLNDGFNREHTYLRISLTERCNLRCTYCMPAEGVKLSPHHSLMDTEEVLQIAKTFVDMGVTKIRLTGGEPFVRKDIDVILNELTNLPIELGITTNGILMDRHMPLLKSKEISNLNISLDTLNREKFRSIARRDHFKKVMDNIYLALSAGILPRINVVLLKGFNDDEITDFIAWTKDLPVVIRFIEFMPFEGNAWQKEKLISLSEVLQKTAAEFGSTSILRINDKPNDTSKNFKIKGFSGSFSVISTVTNPFCDTCNRIRLTANGQLKNCLFSSSETDLLGPLRNGEAIQPLIKKNLLSKNWMRGGMNTLEEFSNPENNQDNRSMILIGG